MGFRCLFSAFAGVAVVVAFSSCPIPFGYYPSGSELVSGVETDETIAAAPVSTPVFVAVPASGGAAVTVSGTTTVYGDQSIRISCATEGALVYYTYTTDTSEALPRPEPFEPSTRLFNAAEPIVAVGDKAVVRIKAIALKSLLCPSAIASLELTVTYSSGSVPAVTAVVPTVDGVIVAWNPVAGATSYNLYYKEGTSVTPADGRTLAGVNSPRTATGLLPNQQYAFTLTSVTANGESAQGETFVAVPLTFDATGLAVKSASSFAVCASWLELGDVSNYELYMDTDGSGAFDKLVWSGYATTTIVSGLEPGKIYYFLLRPYYHTGSPVTPSQIVPAATYSAADMPVLANVPTGSFPPPTELPSGATPPDEWLRTDTSAFNGWIQGGYTYLVWDHDLQQSYAFAIAAYDAGQSLVSQWVVEDNGYISRILLNDATWDFSFFGEVETVIPWRDLKL